MLNNTFFIISYNIYPGYYDMSRKIRKNLRLYQIFDEKISHYGENEIYFLEKLGRKIPLQNGGF